MEYQPFFILIICHPLRKNRNSQARQIFIFLSATLLGLYVSFLIMAIIDSAYGSSNLHPTLCGCLAGSVHYFVLASFAWMGVEGFNTYLVVVKIFNTYIPNFMTKAIFLAYGKF